MENIQKQTVKVVPISCEKFREGKSAKTGKAWTLYNVNCGLENGSTRKFSTFSDLSAKINSPVEVAVWEEEYDKKDGTKGKSWKLELPRQDAWTVIRDLQKRVEALENFMLGANKKGLPNATSPEDEEISMPF